jgi:hypothetical protein
MKKKMKKNTHTKNAENLVNIGRGEGGQNLYSFFDVKRGWVISLYSCKIGGNSYE